MSAPNGLAKTLNRPEAAKDLHQLILGALVAMAVMLVLLAGFGSE
jgi:hypothetical protein